MSVVALGLMAAVVNAAQGLLNKDLTDRYPARRIIGVLLLMNCLLLLPFAPFVEWHWSPQILALHMVSAFLLGAGAVPTWDLFDSGAASATTTAQALSPLAAILGVALFIPQSTSMGQVIAAVVVVAGVTWALRDAFTSLGRLGSTVRILISAAGFGLLTVASRMLADEGVGVVETYVVRTGLAAAVLLVLIPPRGVPRSAAPRLLLRSIAVTFYFVLIILAVQQGSPVVVQTLVAITPLLVLGVESVRSRTWPPARALAGALLVVIGVGLVLVVA